MGLRVANVFHAGDGNLHPLILYDANKPGELEKTEEFGAEILKLCVEVGGVLTGEHGVGVEKRDLMPAMFTEIDLNQQQRLKCAFDAQGLLNPGKVFPDAAPLRRARPAACACRQAAVPGHSAVLKAADRNFRAIVPNAPRVQASLAPVTATAEELVVRACNDAHGTPRLAAMATLRPAQCQLFSSTGMIRMARGVAQDAGAKLSACLEIRSVATWFLQNYSCRVIKAAASVTSFAERTLDHGKRLVPPTRP